MKRYARVAWRLMLTSPGPWLLTASLCGWLVLIVRALAGSLSDPLMSAPMAGHQHIGHSHSHDLIDWLAMVLAMLPLVLRSELAWLWRTNLPRNRWAAVAVLVIAYATPWFVLGVAWLALLAGRKVEDFALLGATALLLLWHASPSRQRLLNACHRRPGLRAFGTGMAVDTARFGLRSGLSCTGICAPAMMLVMALPGYHLVAMTGLTVVLTIERYLAPRRPTWHFPWNWIDRAPRWHSLNIVAARTVLSG